MYRLLFEDRAVSRAPFVSNRTTAVIGRDPACQLRLIDHGIRDRHAVIERRADGYYIRDLARANGVHVNGAVVTEQRLATGDELELGAVRLRFEVLHDPPPGRRAFDPLMLMASLVVVVLVVGQIGLFAWIFSTSHPSDMRTDVSKPPTVTTEPAEPAAGVAGPALLPLMPGERDSAPPPAQPEVLNRMIKVVRVERMDAADSVTLKIAVKAQVGERQLDVSTVAVGVQFFGPPASARDMIWLALPRDWENFSTKTLSARFAGPPGRCAGYVVRTYYRRQLQDVAAAPALAPATPAPPVP